MQKHKRYIYTISIILLSFVAIICCEKSNKRIGEVKIGLIAMLTGENAQNGRNMADGARLAVDRVNERGGLKLGKRTHRVVLIIEDERGSPDGAMDAARKLIFKEEVNAIVGPQFSSSAIPVAKLAEKEKVVMLAPMSTHPETTAGKRYVFRIPYLDTFQGMVIGRFAREVLGAETAAVLYDVAGVYNRTLAEIFRETFERSGGVVNAFETYTTDQNQDFMEQLGRISSAAPHVLFLPNYSGDVLIQAHQARKQGITAILLGGDGWDQVQVTQIGDFDGSYMTRHWDPGIYNDISIAFRKAYKKRYGRDPEDVAATTYDAIEMLCTAIEFAGKADAGTVQKALYSVGTYRGVTGTISYTESGDPVKSAVIVGIKNGSASVHTIIEP
jgi:branched-chain amino acid transport system substrate-binding protein